jgi:acyl-homoserine-lactone acylase
METGTTGRPKGIPRIIGHLGRPAWPRWRAVAVVAVGTVAAAVVLTVTGTASAGQSADPGGYAASVRRTGYGIPHVLAHDYGSLGYGYGYAFAQDNLCVLADQVVTVRGRRSEFFGPDALATDALDPSASNVDSDTYYQALRDAGTVRRLLAVPAPLGPTVQARQLVDGYVAGINRYLRDTGVARLPDPTCRGQAWVGPVTALDVWTLVYAVDVFGGAGALKQAIATAVPGAGGTPAPPPGKGGVPAAPADLTGEIGSNGWALGAAATRAHDGMLLANPHVPWTGDARLYQVQLTMPGVLDVTGAALYGVPVVMIGHTERLAWTLTASHAQHASIYRLSLVPGDPTSYLVDGRAVAMGQQTVRVPVRGGDGTLSTVTRTLYTSRYGPVLATGWTTASAYAIRDANADNLRSVNEWLAIDRAQSLTELRAAHQTYQGLPWMYTLATDTGGTTFFADTSVVPHLTDQQAARCVLRQTDPERPDILDGSTTACDWGRDPDAAEPGIFAPSRAPTLTRSDYVANSNNSPLLANPAEPLTGYPAAYDTRTQPELRPRLSLTMIAQRVAGTDGLGAPGFTLPTLQATMLGDRVESADLGRSDVVAMCRAHPVLTASDGTRVDVVAACCDVLANWDGTAGRDSAGAVLWAAFFDQLGGDPSASWWRVPYDPARPVTTPSGINGDDPQVQHALADVVEEFDAGHLPIAATPGQTMAWDGIPLHGCDEQAGCFNVVTASPGSGHNAIDRSPDNAAQGSSFIMAVELTPRGPVARTILTYSESANPASPHYSDQTALFSRSQWVTERFTEAQINADPTMQLTVLHG